MAERAAAVYIARAHDERPLGSALFASAGAGPSNLIRGDNEPKNRAPNDVDCIYIYIYTVIHGGGSRRRRRSRKKSAWEKAQLAPYLFHSNAYRFDRLFLHAISTAAKREPAMVNWCTTSRRDDNRDQTDCPSIVMGPASITRGGVVGSHKQTRRNGFLFFFPPSSSNKRKSGWARIIESLSGM